jgi:hypothetical protein
MEGSSPTLTNCTISGNSASWPWGTGGGVSCTDDSFPAVINCIIWGNSPESVCGSLSHCLIAQDPQFVQPGIWITCAAGDDPLCVAYRWDPQTNEPTAWRRWVFDYRLRPGSPAIDAGACDGAPATDIEGTPRPQGAGCDIGAYEYSPEEPLEVRFLRGEITGNGSVDMSDAVAILGYLFLGSAELSCLKSADTDDSGVLDLTDAVYLLRHLFLGGQSIPEPFAACGWDLTLDDLTCEAYPLCE